MHHTNSETPYMTPVVQPRYLLAADILLACMVTHARSLICPTSALPHRRTVQLPRRVICGLWRRHVHTGLNLVALCDGLGLLPYLDLVVLLDERAARTPKRHTAVAAPTALDPVPFSNLATLQHGIAATKRLAKLRLTPRLHVIEDG